ncbi:MAG: translocation/assembly module TamB domain-containing protein [Nitrospirae bacterium]|nr:translocation/assembly module TamB domain-containing protein [Nitrospirota bacterium]
MYKKSLAFLLVILLLALTFHLLLRGGLFSESLTRFAAARIQDLTGTPVTLRRVTLSLIPTAAVLEGVVLPFPEPGRPPITVEQIRVTVSPWSLLTEVTFIKKISFIRPEIVLRTGEGSLLPIRTDFGKVSSSPSADQPRRFNAVIRAIEIHNGRIVIEPVAGKPVLTLSDLEGNVAPDLRMETFNAIVSAEGMTLDLNGFHKKLESVTAQMTLQSHDLEIQKLEATDPVSRYTFRGAVRDLTHPRLALSVEAFFPLDDLAALLPGLLRAVPVAGKTQFSGEATGSWPDLTVRGDLSVSGMTVSSKPAGDLKTVLVYQNRAFSFSEFSAAVFGGQLAGNIRLSLPESAEIPIPYQLLLTFSELDPSAFLPIVGIEGYPARQRLEGALELTGAGLDPAGLTGSGRLHLTEQKGSASVDPHGQARGGLPASTASERGRLQPALPVEGATQAPIQAGPIEILARLREAAMRFEIDHGTLSLDQTTARTARSSLTIRGRIQTDGPMAVQVRLETDDIAEPASVIPLHGIGGGLKLDGKLTGTWRDPVFKGEGRARNLQLRGHSFETVESDLFYQNRTIRFKKAVFREKQARYEITGLVAFKPSENGLPGPFFDIAAKIRQGSPRDVVAIFTKELPILVPASGELTAKGVPKQFRLTARLQAGAGSIYGQTVDEGTVSMQLTQDRIVFKEAQAKQGMSVLSGQGWIRFNGEFEFSAETAEARLEDFDPVKKQLDRLRGPFSGRILGRGSFRDPHIEIELAFPDVAYQDRSFGPGRVSVKVEGHRLTADLHLSKGVNGDGEMEWVPGHPYRVALTLDKADLWPWIGSSGSAASDRSAVVHVVTTGTITARGQIDSASGMWYEADAAVHLTSLAIDFQDYLITNEGDIRIELQKGNAILQSLRLKGPGTVLTASGDLQLFKSYNLFVSGEADLDLFRIFTKEITYGKGLAYLALQVTDRWDNPKIRGGVIIHDGLVKSATWGQTITITSVGLSFNERQVLLESLNAQLGDGRLQASGRIDLVRFAPVRFGVDLEIVGARIASIPGMTAFFDASLTLQGDLQTQSLSGEVEIRRASYERRLDWQTWILEFLKQEKTEPISLPLLKSTALNIQIRGKENLRINNNLAKLPIEADLLLKGTVARPVLLGRVEAKGGTFSFRRNDFKVLSGTLDFINPERIRPIIDLRAVTHVKEYDIDLSLVGPIDKFDLQLSSDPPLKDENEVLCLLTFRRRCKEVETASKEIGTAEASALVSGEIQTLITDKVEAITGIDRIQVDPYYATSKSGGGPQITVSKRLLEDKLYVTYVTTLDPSQEQLIQMEYAISKNVSLIGQRDELGRVGGDLKLHFEFR